MMCHKGLIPEAVLEHLVQVFDKKEEDITILSYKRWCDDRNYDEHTRGSSFCIQAYNDYVAFEK